MINDANKTDLLNYIQKKVEKTLYYKDLMARKYRKIDGFYPYTVAAKKISRTLFLFEFCVKQTSEQKNISLKSSLDFFINQEPVEGLNYVTCREFYQNRFPVFALNKNLAEAFLNSDPPKNVSNINPFALGGVLLLPQGLLKNPDGNELQYLCFRFVKAKQVLTNTILGMPIDSIYPPFNQIRCCSLLGISAYCFDFFADRDETHEVGDTDSNDFYPSIASGISDKDAETRFTSQVKNLLLQTFLYMQFKTSDLPMASNATQGFSRYEQKSASVKPLTPIVIGQDYKIKKETIPDRDRTSSGTHASPIAHWRRGHYRQQAIGSRDNKSHKTIWIEPIFVQAATES